MLSIFIATFSILLYDLGPLNLLNCCPLGLEVLPMDWICHLRRWCPYFCSLYLKKVVLKQRCNIHCTGPGGCEFKSRLARTFCLKFCYRKIWYEALTFPNLMYTAMNGSRDQNGQFVCVCCVCLLVLFFFFFFKQGQGNGYLLSSIFIFSLIAHSPYILLAFIYGI